jgi:hypothetical protein
VSWRRLFGIVNGPHLVESVPVGDGVSVLGVGGRGALCLARTLALLFYPRTAIGVNLVANTVGTADRQ